jgi:hypothetical protein
VRNDLKQWNVKSKYCCWCLAICEMKIGHELMWYTCEFRRKCRGSTTTNQASMVGRCSMPILYLIDNKPWIQIYVRVNIAKERKDVVKRTWNEIQFLVVDSWTLILNKDIFKEKNPKRPPLDLISRSPIGQLMMLAKIINISMILMEL